MKKSSVPYIDSFFGLKKKTATEAQIQNSWAKIQSKITAKSKDEESAVGRKASSR
jgi:hypothetical protein